MEYAAKFNELSRFAPNQVAMEEMRMDHFEQELRGEVKQIITGYTYDNFQEMYQKDVKIARIISETEIEDRENVRPAFLSYLLNKYYACWVGKFYFSICQCTSTLLPMLSTYPISDPKNKLSEVV